MILFINNILSLLSCVIPIAYSTTGLFIVVTTGGWFSCWDQQGIYINTCVHQIHRVIILNRGSMFGFQWREFSPSLRSAHRVFQCYHSQWEIGDAAIPPQPPATIGPLANERAVLSDVMLWRCTFWSGKFASFSSYSIVKACSL